MELKEFIVIGLLAVFVVGSLGFISAEKVPTDDVGQGFIDRIISKINYIIHENELFTIYGEEMGCSVKPNYQSKFNTWTPKGIRCQGNDYMMNYYRGYPEHENGMQYIKEFYYRADEDTAYVTDVSKFGSGEGNIYDSPSIECDAGAYWDNNCYLEVYCCPDGACESDNECETDEKCDKENPHISQTFPGLGICKYEGEEPPTHTTEVYRCQKDGTAVLSEEVSYDSDLACADPDKNRYKYYDTGAGCWTPENQQCHNYTKEENGGNGEVQYAKSTKEDNLMNIPGTDLDEYLCGHTFKHGAKVQRYCPSESKSKCVLIDNLIEDNSISEDRADYAREEICNFNAPWLARAVFGLTGKGLFAELFGDDSYYETCDAPGGRKDYFRDNYGFCIEEEEEEGFFEQIGKAVPITGNAQTDGIIVIAGGLFMLIILMNQGYYIGGKEYEISK